MSVIDNFKLDGRIVVVTGGAGLLGREFSRAISEVGGISIVADIDHKGAVEVANKIGLRGKLKSEGYFVDITDKKSVGDLIHRVFKKYGRIDGLVNNAALNPKFENLDKDEHTNAFGEFPLELWNKSLDVDLTGMFLCTQAVAPIMEKAGRGSIVNISSIYGMVGPDQRLYLTKNQKAKQSFKPPTYSVTKSAESGFTKYLAAYWAGKNIRVNTLTLGGVFDSHDSEFVKRYSAKTPMGRMAKKDEYNSSLVYLLSDASSYMTGSNLVIDGGWTAW